MSHFHVRPNFEDEISLRGEDCNDPDILTNAIAIIITRFENLRHIRFSGFKT